VAYRCVTFHATGVATVQEKVRVVYRNNQMARPWKWWRYYPYGGLIVVRGIPRKKSRWWNWFINQSRNSISVMGS